MVDLLKGIAQEITDHPDVVGIGQLHNHDNVRATLLQRGMNWMPDTRPA